MISTPETEPGAQGRCSWVQTEGVGGSQLPLQGQMVSPSCFGEVFRDLQDGEESLGTPAFSPWPGEQDLTDSNWACSQ